MCFFFESTHINTSWVNFIGRIKYKIWNHDFNKIWKSWFSCFIGQLGIYNWTLKVCVCILKVRIIFWCINIQTYSENLKYSYKGPFTLRTYIDLFNLFIKKEKNKEECVRAFNFYTNISVLYKFKACRHLK